MKYEVFMYIKQHVGLLCAKWLKNQVCFIQIMCVIIKTNVLVKKLLLESYHAPVLQNAIPPTRTASQIGYFH